MSSAYFIGDILNFSVGKAVKTDKLRRNSFFEGETDEEREAREAEEEANKKKTPKVGDTNPNTGKLFTQAEVNAMIKADKDAAKKERDRLIKELQTMQEQGLTTENMATLQERIEQLQSEGKTQEERTKEALAKKDQEHAKQLGITQAESKKWREDYQRYRAESEIRAAAERLKADNPTQVYKLLKGDVHYVEKLDGSGKGTGEWIPKIRMEVTKDDETKVLDLSPEEAIKQMTEMPEHSNLFNSGASGGIGGGNNGGTKSGSTALPKTMAGYMKARKEDPSFHTKLGKK